jgi:nitrogen-specific signal transduction histidine kinase
MSEQQSSSSGSDGGQKMTLAHLRHDIRNHLNAIKLSCALLQRRQSDPMSDESIREIDRAADRINELITRHIGDNDAARNLL